METGYMLPGIAVQSGRCLQRRLRGFECSLCVDSCHVKAVTLKEGGIYLDSDSCTSCGRCAAVCPAEVFVIDGNDPYSMLEAVEASLQVVISCRRQNSALSPSLPVLCLGALPFEAFLFLAIHQQNDILINMAGCADCENSPVTAQVNSAVTRIAQLEPPRPLAKFIRVRDSAELPSDAPGNRRAFLMNTGDNILSFVRARLGPKAPLPDAFHTHRRRIPGKTAILEKAVTALDRESRSIISAACLPLLTIRSSCSLCPRCAGICPTGALGRVIADGIKQLVFQPEKCTACGLCVEFCKDRSLELRKAIE